MHQWPTFNNHTDITGVMSASHSSYWSVVWLDGGATPAGEASATLPLVV